MTLERRLVVLAGAAVAIAVAVASSGVYLGVRGALRDEIDRSLQNRLDALALDEISRQPDDARPEILTEQLTWQPAPGPEALRIDLPAYFARVLGEA